MQGNLREINIYSILEAIESGQQTGLLLVNTDRSDCDQQQVQLIFFLHGQIVYATYGDNSLSRLRDYLHLDQRHINLKLTTHNLSMPWNIPEYSCLWDLLANNIINIAQARSIIYSLVNEVLFDLLSLHEGRFIFDSTSLLTPHLTSLAIAPTLSRVLKQVQNWKQLYPYIQSPEQYPVLADTVQLNSVLPPSTIKKLQHWADGTTSLRQIARYLNCDIFTFSKAICPYVEKGWVKIASLANLNQDDSHLTEKHNPLKKSSPRRKSKPEKCIACIGKKDYMGKSMESTLKANGYQAIALSDPLESLSILFKLQPDFIFCQIAMPELDGYEICSMLRNSNLFREVPIVLVREKEEVIECLQAKIIGATDYLTVPFGNNELVTILEKYLQTDKNDLKGKQDTQDLLISSNIG